MELANDVMVMLEDLALKKNGLMLIPELYLVPDGKVEKTLYIKTKR